jgi:acyl carrier protein
VKNDIQHKLLSIVKTLMIEKGQSSKIELLIPLNESGLGFDSITHLTLLHRIETGFSIDFPEESWGDKPFRNLHEILQYLFQVLIKK